MKLIRRPLKDAPGESFFFEINRKPIYTCGTNWVPAQNQTPKVTNERYAKWVDLALRNNNDMIRVWGGGTRQLQIVPKLAPMVNIDV